MPAHDPWKNVPHETIERFLLDLCRIISEDGWDQPSSLRHIKIEEEQHLTSSHPRLFQDHPGDFLDGKHASKHVDAIALSFEGWTYPDALSSEEIGEKGALVRPSQHPRRIEMRQTILMARNGITYSAFQKRGEGIQIEQVNIQDSANKKEIAGTITHAMRCYIQAPYYKNIPTPYITWLRNVVGQTLTGVVEYASEKGATQQDLTRAAQDIAMLIEFSLKPEKGEGSPALQTIKNLKERHSAPSPQTTWEQVRDNLILDAYLTQQSSRVRHLKWLDDAALQEMLDDPLIDAKTNTLISIIDDPHTKTVLKNAIATIEE